LGLGFVEEIDIDLNSGGIENSYSSNNNLAYQLIAGVAYSLNKDWDVTTDLRYIRINSITLKNEKEAGELRRIDYNPVSLSLGVMYKF
jgi:outer membrane protein W